MKNALPQITRYAVTYVNRDGFRVLAHANQGRNHFETLEEAQTHIAATLANNSRDTLESVFGPHLDTLEATPTKCYSHGDAIGTVFPGYYPERDLTSDKAEKAALRKVFADELRA